MVARKTSLDDVLSGHLGEFGLYQKVHYILVGIPALFAGFHALSWSFAGAKLNFRCRYPGEDDGAVFDQSGSTWHQQLANLTTYDKGCYRLKNVSYGSSLPNTGLLEVEPCVDGYIWDNPDGIFSVVNRWNLVCERDVVIALIQSLYFLGQFLGSSFLGTLSDKIGRKPVFLMAILLQMICGACTAFMPSWQLVALMRFGVGFGHPGVYIMACVVGAELVGPKYRHWGSIIAGILWAIATMILGASAYVLTDYRHLQLAISLPAILLMSYWWILPESARWLMSQGRAKEMHNILHRVAKWNGRPSLPTELREKVTTHKPTEFPFYQGMLALFKTPRIRVRTLISFLLWAAATMGYYGLSMNPGFMGGDNRLAFILNGIFEIPGLLMLTSLNVIGRKYLSSLLFFITALCLTLTLIVPGNIVIGNLLLVVIGNSAVGAVYGLMFIWTPEHYPTVIRNTATGACSMIGRVGGIAASFFSLKLADEYPTLVAVTFAVLSALACVLSILQPETSGEPLVETIEEAEMLGLDQPYFISGYENQNRPKQQF